MSDSSAAPVPYRVSYTSGVRHELLRLAERARERGIGAEFLAAVKEIDRRLRIYPHLGQPLYDLKLEPAQVWIGIVPPVVVRYVLDEERRTVMVATPFLLLPEANPNKLLALFLGISVGFNL